MNIKQVKKNNITEAFGPDEYGGIARYEFIFDKDSGKSCVYERGDLCDDFSSVAEFLKEKGDELFLTIIDCAASMGHNE